MAALVSVHLVLGVAGVRHQRGPRGREPNRYDPEKGLATTMPGMTACDGQTLPQAAEAKGVA